MKVFNKITKIIIFPAYYLIHKNVFFGFIHKYLIKEFNYKNFKFFLNIKNISLSSHSSFFFKLMNIMIESWLKIILVQKINV